MSLMGVKSPFPNFVCPGKLFEILAPFSSEQISDTRQTWYKVVQISFSPQPSVDTEIKDGSYNFLQEYNKLSLAKSLQA